MAPQLLKLTYFNASGRAEVTRLALHYGNIPFIDHRVSFEEFGTSIKPNLPLGQVPLLDIDEGKTTLVQSAAIQSYAARLAGLYPEDSVVIAKVEMVLHTLEDLFPPLVILLLTGNLTEDEKEKTIQTYVEVTLPRAFSMLENLIEPSSTFMMGNEPTLADLGVFSFITNGVLPGGSDIIAQAFDPAEYPNLHRVITKVAEHPALQNYLNN